MNNDENNGNGSYDSETNSMRESLNMLAKLLGMPTMEEIEATAKRGTNFIGEWSCQSAEDVKQMPLQIGDLKTTLSSALGMAVSRQITLIELVQCQNRAVEAAYNLGRSHKPVKKEA